MLCNILALSIPKSNSLFHQKEIEKNKESQALLVLAPIEAARIYKTAVSSFLFTAVGAL